MKQCKIYYATVIETEGRWAKKGEKCVEPVRVESRAPLGKAPEYCCEGLKSALESRHLYTGDEYLQIQEQFPYLKINFCPLCGAKIVYIPNLKLKSLKCTRTYDSYYFDYFEEV